MVVQHNMQAANANRMLNVTTSAQSKSTEKLSSGYKINRAADDAAGLTISEKMRKQIKGLDQASTNAEDGVSAVQTAEGALTEVHSMLQRMNELATQAANGTNSKESDRQAIQDEIDQLTTEIDRVSETTKFNETYLLKGDAGTKTINLKAHDAGLKGTLTDNGDGTATFTMDALKGGDKISIGGAEYTIGGTTEQDVKDFLKKNGVDDKAGSTFSITANNVTSEFEYKEKVDDEDTDGDGNTDIYGYKAGWYKKGEAQTSTSQAGQTAINNKQLGDSYEKFATQDGTFTAAGKSLTKTKITDVNPADGVDDKDSKVISVQKAYELAGKELLKANQIGDTEGHSAVVNATDGSALAYNAGDGSFKISVAQAKVANTLSFNLQVGADADLTNKIQVNIDAMDSASLGIKSLNVKDDSGNAATYAIDAISDAISKVSSQRSSLGAVQNRLEHTINNLDNVVENTTSAESRIRDTDMAEEMVNYSKNNILAQAGQSMLAQANQSNQGVLSLLQ